MKSKAIFLDRDGVLNFQPKLHDYVKSWQEFKWIPKAKEAIKAINDAGYLTVVISNQRGVARGLMRKEDVEDIHNHMQADLKRIGAKVDGFYFCGHDYSDECECRKPKPGLILQAANDFNIDLKRSSLIGDDDNDVEAGKKAGCRVIKIKTNGSLLLAVKKF